MRAVIIGNGSFYEGFRFLPEDVVICADGGFNHASEYGIHANFVIGDMDSVKVDITGENTRIYPTKKDFTDSELAVELAFEEGCDEIILLAMTGTRLDHTIANICLLKRIAERGAKGVIIDKKNTIYYIKDRVCLDGLFGKTVSLIPLNGDLTGVSNSGLMYPLNNETVYYGATRGISNEVISDEADITVSGGEGIVVVTNGE